MSDNQEILTALAAIIEEVAGTPAAEVVPSAEFQGDLDLDSLSMVEVVVAAEQKFDVRIPDGDVANLVTVGDAINYIEKAGLAAGNPA